MVIIKCDCEVHIMVSEQLSEMGTIVAIINFREKRGLENLFHFSKPLLRSFKDSSLNQYPHSLTINVWFIRKKINVS